MRFSNLRTVLGSTVLVYGAGCGSVNQLPPDAAADSTATPDAMADAAPDSPPAVPVNQMNAGTVDENGTLSLMNHLVTVDTDTLPASLTYAVRSLPADGTLKKDGTPLAIGMTFTQDDVNSGKLSYDQDGAENATDGFNWDLSDGVNTIPPTGTNTFAITVTPVNDAPVIVNNPVTMLAEGSTRVLTNGDLSVSDIENNTPLTYSLLAVMRGQLQKDPGTGTFAAIPVNGTFTQADISGGKIRFVDPGTDDAMLQIQQNTSASFSWRVQDADGGFNPSATGSNIKTFTVTSVDDPPVTNFAANRCYHPIAVNPANPVIALSDADNPITAYQICIVSIGTGDSVVFGSTTDTIGTTETGKVPTVKNGTLQIFAGSCIQANALGGLTFSNNANRYGGSITWKLMKGTTQVGNAFTVQFIQGSPPC